METSRGAEAAKAGEIAELRYGQPMTEAGASGVRVKFVVTADGLTAIALAKDESAARAALARLGFPAESVESRCVGECCADEGPSGEP